MTHGTRLTRAMLGRRLKRDGLPLLLFACAALLASYPLAFHLRTRIIGWKGDNVSYVYATGWSSQALLLGQSPFVDPRLNYPDGLALSATDVPFLSILLTAPFTLLGGPIFGYNLIILLSSLLS